MFYNEDYINLFNEGIYLKYLNNKDFLKIIREQYLNRNSADDSIKIEVKNVLFKESLDHYILKRITTDPSFIDSAEMKNYMEHILDLAHKSVIELATNVIFRDKKIREQLIDRFYSKDKATINDLSNKIDIKLDDILDRIKNKQPITQNDLNKVCVYFSNFKIRSFKTKEGIDYFELLLNYIYNDMLESDLEFSYQVQEFLMSRIPFEYDGKLYGVRVVLGNSDNGIDIKGPGHSSGNSSYVAMNKEMFRNIRKSIDDSKVERLVSGNDFTFLNVVLFHEITHQLQRKNSTKDYIDNDGLACIMQNIFSKELKDYKVNHDSASLEIDANKHSWENCSNFYAKYYHGMDSDKLVSNCRVNMHTSKIRRKIAYKEMNDGTCIPYDEYDFVMLTKIIKSKPDYLKIYPMLRKFYNDDGSLNISFMFEKTMYTDENCMEFVHGFFKTDRHTELINYLNQHKLSDSQVTSLIDNMYYYVLDRLYTRGNLEYVINHDSIGEYRKRFDVSTTDDFVFINYDYATDAINKSNQIYDIIEKLYPNSKKYIDFVRKSYDEALDKYNCGLSGDSKDIKAAI